MIETSLLYQRAPGDVKFALDALTRDAGWDDEQPDWVSEHPHARVNRGRHPRARRAAGAP